MAKPGRKPREPLPKGEEAEAELARIRRNERRKRRHAIKKAAELGLPPPDEHPDDVEAPPPVEVVGIPTAEELRQQMWGAFGDLGGQAGLVAWGRRYPKEFYSVWARVCLPKQLDGGPPPENSLEALLSKLGDDDD